MWYHKILNIFSTPEKGITETLLPGQFHLSDSDLKKLAAEVKGTKLAGQIIPKAESRVRKDIKSWNKAIEAARDIENPSRYDLSLLYDEIELDLLLSSQIQNRKNITLGAEFEIHKNGKLDETLTELLKSKIWLTEINDIILRQIYFGHALMELELVEKDLKVVLLPYGNIVPEGGYLLPDADDTEKRIVYRGTPEYGKWLIEFGKHTDLGLLNKVVPHVLFKRFAESCWSELCEIYGIPPRYMKTNTQDPAMVKRASKMMSDMGAAAWFIIDETESFEFAKGVATNGDVYHGLITLCNNEMSMGISGAVIGQDTKNGSRSKEDSNQELLETLATFDKMLIQQAWNTKVIIALQKIGILPAGDITYKYKISEDIEALWGKTKDALAYYEIPADWIKNTFGIEATGPRKVAANPNTLGATDFFG